MSLRNAFRDPYDWLHAALGFAACLINLLPYGWIPSIAIMLTFVVYETLQAEKPIDSYCDILEFLVGCMLAVPVLLFLT